MKQIFAQAALALLLAAGGSLVCAAQTGTKPPPAKPETAVSGKQAAVKNSPAYAEVLLRKTEVEAELEDLLVEYTEEYPKVRETRHELGLLSRELEKLVALNPNDAGKLTLALGKLIVRKAQLETDLWVLLLQYNEAHDDVKRAKRKVATFEKAIKEILP